MLMGYINDLISIETALLYVLGDQITVTLLS